MKINKMNQGELVELSNKLGGRNSETFEESMERFQELGDFDTAAKFEAMINRWYELEG